MSQYIIALIGTITAVITVSLTNYFSKKNSIQLEERKIKQDYYIQFIKTLSDSMNNLVDDDVVIAHNHAYNNLMLVASPQVINAITKYQNLVIDHIKSNNVTDYPEKHDKLLSYCFKEMRADLYGYKSKINKNYPNKITFLSGVLRIKK
ncbi:hypothetical protein ACSVC9_12085 [Clostridium sp. LBM24168]